MSPEPKPHDLITSPAFIVMKAAVTRQFQLCSSKPVM